MKPVDVILNISLVITANTLRTKLWRDYLRTIFISYILMVLHIAETKLSHMPKNIEKKRWDIS